MTAGIKKDIDLEQVRIAAAGVPDPEIRLTLGELDLIDEVLVGDEGEVTIRYHLTSPLCPSPFAVQIGREVRRRVEALEGVSRCRVDIRDHFIAADISAQVNDSPPGTEPSWL
ncbi:unannotated protein [freshwater metagenome]|uniref:Unannotated protein n=1 Tax=freshwater metagenome TaxID=449393 RepID=A0A6J7T0W4_9ZZZZ|nr:DUF59 domain-containing protein [Actinomycetota bacterium]